jgi:glycosyltransferase involved in cell wall biosynthesis
MNDDGVRSGKQEVRPNCKLVVRQFLRHPVQGWYSIEGTFETVRRHLDPDIHVDVVTNRYPSRGLLPRLKDAVNARRNRGPVNHVLGDVHYLTWFLPRRHTILTIHDCIPLEQARGLRWFALWALWYWLPAKKAGQLTVVSEFTRKSLERWIRYPADRITVVPPPLTPGFESSKPRPHGKWRRLLHIGSTPNKNLGRVIEAVAGLDITLVIVGRVDDASRELLTEHLVAHENHVDLDTDALIEQFHRADILLFPSTYEGWGMPIIEAQAVGRPVITSNVASMPEASGGAACLVDPFNVESIRAGVTKVLTDEDYALGLINDGRKNARKYSAGAITARYTEVYRRIQASE